MKLYKCKLDDLGTVSRGKSKHRPRNDKSLFGGEYPFIQTGEVKATEFYLNAFSETYNEKGLAQSKLWDEGTLMITISANIAETAILNIKACFPDSILGFIPFEGKSDVIFIKYYMDFIKKKLQNISQGTTQDNMSVKKLLSMWFYVPDYTNQKKIANILSNYDKLIENNNQRIKLLESMAEELYKEWFVRLRFPDYEKNNIEKVTIGTLVDLRQGFALNSKSKHYISDRGIPLLKISDLFNDTETLFVNNNIPKQFLVYENEIIYTRTAQVGYVFMDKRGVVYNNCFKVIPKNDLYTKFIYYFLKLKSTRYFAQTLATGTAQADLNHDSFKRMKINYPKEEVVISFNKIIEPFDKKIKTLVNKNKNLKESRDLLLPRLIHGKLKV